jgi:hypothetical protein
LISANQYQDEFEESNPCPASKKVCDAAHGKCGTFIYFCSQTEILYLCHRHAEKEQFFAYKWLNAQFGLCATGKNIAELQFIDFFFRTQ